MRADGHDEFTVGCGMNALHGQIVAYILCHGSGCSGGL